MTINRTPETVATESRIGRKKATRNRKATKSTVGVRSTAERRGAVDARGEGRGTTGPSRQSDELVALAEEDAELWHGSDKVAYATIDAGGHREHCRLDDETFTDWLAERFHGQAGRVPNGQQIADALRVLKFKARKGACYRPAIRVAWHDGANWFDLGDDKWRAVRIDGNGWSVVDRPPVRFVRTSFTDTLPEPVAGRPIEDLRDFLNVGDCDFILIVAWLVAALWGRASSRPVLVLGGEQGSGKTTMARLLRSLVDPSGIDVTVPPRDERDLFIMASQSHLLSFDNVSRIDAKLADAICRLSTGAAFATRRLHTDSSLTSFRAARPIILNGIPILTDRPDLADRSVGVRLLKIGDESRRAENEWWDAWNAARAGILGALCDGITVAIRRYEQVKLGRLPRMAEFALLVEAAAPGLGWEEGMFAAAYETNRHWTAEASFEAHPVAVAIVDFMGNNARQTRIWEGTATELLAEINDISTKDIRRTHGWPRTANALGSVIEQVMPLLWLKGIGVSKRHTGDRRVISLTCAEG